MGRSAIIGGSGFEQLPGLEIASSAIVDTPWGKLIDDSWGRPTTFHDGGAAGVVHIDFTAPYDAPLRRRFLAVAAVAGVPVNDGGTLAVTRGPRLETAAEIRRLRQDGCDLVGMTAIDMAGEQVPEQTTEATPKPAEPERKYSPTARFR
jgi:purine nucleoside phosphorylase